MAHGRGSSELRPARAVALRSGRRARRTPLACRRCCCRQHWRASGSVLALGINPGQTLKRRTRAWTKNRRVGGAEKFRKTSCTLMRASCAACCSEHCTGERVYNAPQLLLSSAPSLLRGWHFASFFSRTLARQTLYTSPARQTHVPTSPNMPHIIRGRHPVPFTDLSRHKTSESRQQSRTAPKRFRLPSGLHL